MDTGSDGVDWIQPAQIRSLLNTLMNFRFTLRMDKHLFFGPGRPRDFRIVNNRNFCIFRPVNNLAGFISTISNIKASLL